MWGVARDLAGGSAIMERMGLLRPMPPWCGRWDGQGRSGSPYNMCVGWQMVRAMNLNYSVAAGEAA